jgi:RHS repeat-associated protein
VGLHRVDVALVYFLPPIETPKLHSLFSMQTPMKLQLRKSAFVNVLLLAGIASAQSIYMPPGTGKELGTVNWSIVGDTTGEASGGIPNFAPVVNLPLPGGWAAPLSGSVWVGPHPDQSNATRGACCSGTTKFELEFPVTSVNQAFNLTVYADDSAAVTLNGVDMPFNSNKQPTLNSPGVVTMNSHFQTGMNTIVITVTNISGPTGLDACFSAATTTITPTLVDKGKSKYHIDSVPDPVDSSSGQFYETESDIELGGPMNLGFRRYYSSQLSNGGASTTLGTNWMSNFDSRAVVSGTNAQVLMFQGTVVSFASAGGVWQLVSPTDVLYQFLQSGTTYQFLDPRSQWVYTFTAAGALATISDRNGNVVTVTQGAVGPTQVSDGLGRTLTFSYTGGPLAKVTDQAARSVTFAYTGSLLTSTTDIYKQTTKYSYTTVGANTGLMTQRQLALGNIPTVQTYDSQGRVVTQTDANGHVAKIAYDGNSGTTITDALGNVTKHVSDGTGDIMQLSDPAGASASITYDIANRRTRITDKLGNRINYTYDASSGLLSSITDALGGATAISYISQTQGGFTYYYLAGISYADGTSIKRTYGTTGNLLTGTGQNGAVTKATYDANGRPISVTGANQQTSTYTWNTDGTIASSTDPLGNKSTFGYDNTKRMTSSVNPNGGTTGYNLDKSTSGPMIAIVPPVSGESVAIYDDQNRQLQDVVNSIGGVYHSDYTLTGQLAAYTDPLKHKTSYTYDADDRLSTVTNSLGEKLTYAYDAANRVSSVSDAKGPRLSYTYTSESQAATVTDGSGRKASYGYDAAGRVTTVTTPSGNVYKTGYDKRGNITSSTNPLGETTSITLDAAGAVTSVAVPGGITTSATRDASEAITSITSANGNIWTLAMDANQRLTRLTDPLGQSSSLTYTGSWITQATLPLGTVAITNDADGRMIKQQFSDGTSFTNAYDANGALTATDGVIIKRDVMGQATSVNGIGITQDGEGRPLTLTYASGKAVTYAYDTTGLLASITDWVGGKTTLNYDGAGNLTSFTYPNGVTTTDSFDADGKLIKIAVGSLASITLTRDAAGKITAADRNLPILPVLASSSQQLSYDAAGQLSVAAYDKMGRVTAQNGRTYTWNLASQLTSFKDGVNSATMTYDGFGEVNSSTLTGATQNFVFNYLLDLPALSMVRQAGVDLRYYVYLPNGILLYSIEAADNTRHFYHFDEMGNTAFLTNDKGTVTDSYAITPYGEVAAHIGTFDNPFVWQGEFGVMQVGQSLYYMRDRYYDASTARFISRDPEMNLNPLTSEPYAYAAGNPMLLIDPYGSNIFDDIRNAFQAAKDRAVAALNFAREQAARLANFAKVQAQRLVNAAAELAAKTQRLADEARRALWPPVVPVAPPALPDPPVRTSFPPSVFDPPASAPYVVTTRPSQAPSNGSPVEGQSTCLKLRNCLHLNSKGILVSGVVSHDGGSVVSNDGGSVISNDGGSLISQDGAGVISHDGGSVVTVLVDGRAFVVSHDGGSLISQDGAGFRINIPLISQDGAGFRNR